MKVAVFDTETTGLLKPAGVPLHHQPKVIELGIAIVENGIIVAEHNWLIDPDEPISAEITKITGIRTEDVADQPPFKVVWNELGAADVFRGCDAAVAHNMPFDRGMVDNEVSRIIGKPFDGWPPVMLCSAAEFHHVFGKRPRLIELYEHFVGRKLEQTHRAIDDVRATVEALQAAKFFDHFKD